jgi:hypothetical protein
MQRRISHQSYSKIFKLAAEITKNITLCVCAGLNRSKGGSHSDGQLHTTLRITWDSQVDTHCTRELRCLSKLEPTKFQNDDD